jgi:hypothetical protein
MYVGLLATEEDLFFISYVFFALQADITLHHDRQVGSTRFTRDATSLLF